MSLLTLLNANATQGTAYSADIGEAGSAADGQVPIVGTGYSASGAAVASATDTRNGGTTYPCVGAEGPPISSVDPDIASVILLLHANEPQGATTLVEQRGGEAFAYNGAIVDTAQHKFGTASIKFGSGAQAVFATNAAGFPAFGTSDFCVEFQALADSTVTNWTSSSIGGTIITRGRMPSGNCSFTIGFDGAGALNFYVTTGGSGATYTMASASLAGLSATAWHHFAFVRYANKLYAYIDGVSKATPVTFTGVVFDNGYANITIGNDDYQLQGFNGWIDEVRVTLGIPRYTAPFTPPSTQFADSATSSGGGTSDSSDAVAGVGTDSVADEPSGNTTDELGVVSAYGLATTATGAAGDTYDYAFGNAPSNGTAVGSADAVSSADRPVSAAGGDAVDQYVSDIVVLMNFDVSPLTTLIGPMPSNGITTVYVSPTAARFGVSGLDLPLYADSVLMWPFTANNPLHVGAGGEAFTVDLWVNQQGFASQHANIIETSGQLATKSDPNAGLHWSISALNNSICFQWIHAGSVCELRITVAYQQWHYIEVSYDGVIPRLFADGVLATTLRIDGFPSTITPGMDIPDLSNASQTKLSALGYYDAIVGAAERFVGYVDDVRITRKVARHTAAYTVVPTPASTYPGLLDYVDAHATAQTLSITEASGNTEVGQEGGLFNMVAHAAVGSGTDTLAASAYFPDWIGEGSFLWDECRTPGEVSVLGTAQGSAADAVQVAGAVMVTISVIGTLRDSVSATYSTSVGITAVCTALSNMFDGVTTSETCVGEATASSSQGSVAVVICASADTLNAAALVSGVGGLLVSLADTASLADVSGSTIQVIRGMVEVTTASDYQVVVSELLKLLGDSRVVINDDGVVVVCSGNQAVLADAVVGVCVVNCQPTSVVLGYQSNEIIVTGADAITIFSGGEVDNGR